MGAKGMADADAALPAVRTNAAIPANIIRFMFLSLSRAMRQLTQVPGGQSVPNSECACDRLLFTWARRSLTGKIAVCSRLFLI